MPPAEVAGHVDAIRHTHPPREHAVTSPSAGTTGTSGRAEDAAAAEDAEDAALWAQAGGFEVVATRVDATHAVVRPEGEMTLSTVRLLTAVLHGQLRLGRRHVRLDVSGLRVPDCGCLRDLLPVHDQFLAADGRLTVTGAGPDLSVLLRLTGADRTLFLVDPNPSEPPPPRAPAPPSNSHAGQHDAGQAHERRIAEGDGG